MKNKWFLTLLPHTTNMEQTTLKASGQVYEKSESIIIE